jgi:Holliday junction DNA helicase RuvA
VTAIRRQDLATLTGISGVGKKTAERLVLELKDKVAEFAEVDTADGEPVHLTTNGEDAVKALVALGIGRASAERAVQQSLAEAPEAAAPELTRRALSSIRE